MTEQDRKFWEDQLTDRNDAYVINGQHYRIGSEGDKYKGFGGQEFTIRLKHTNDIITTTNLWHQGRVPEAYRKQLPDTANFVRKIKVKFED